MSKLINCKSCNNQIASNAKSCPSCGAKNKKIFYKRGWFIALAIIVLISIIAGAGSDDTTTTSTTGSGTTEIKEVNSEKQTTEEEVEDKVPTEYKSALRKAKTYSDTMYMSKEGIYDQLTSEYGEKFTAESAQYAIDNLNVDWNKNALKKAETYQETMSMSKSAIYDQLTSEHGEKFTAEEAQYAVDNLE